MSLYQKTYPGGKDDDFEITWHPYYLNYNASDTSVDKSVLREKKLAGWCDAKIAAATNRVEETGRSVGIHFKHGGKIGHTRDAHQLIHLSQTKRKPAAVQNALVEKLFEAFHEQEKDISDREVLRELAVNAGLDRAEVTEWLESGVDTQVVDQEAEHNRAQVTTGVPTFLIQDSHRVDGAQDLHEFFEAFVKAKEGQAS